MRASLRPLRHKQDRPNHTVLEQVGQQLWVGSRSSGSGDEHKREAEVLRPGRADGALRRVGQADLLAPLLPHAQLLAVHDAAGHNHAHHHIKSQCQPPQQPLLRPCSQAPRFQPPHCRRHLAVVRNQRLQRKRTMVELVVHFHPSAIKTILQQLKVDCCAKWLPEGRTCTAQCGPPSAAE